MLALGLILVLLAGGTLLAVLFGAADDRAALTMGSLDASVSTMTVFLAGAATLLVFIAGLELTRSGLRRERKRRRDAKELSRLSTQQEAGSKSAADPVREPDSAEEPRH